MLLRIFLLLLMLLTLPVSAKEILDVARLGPELPINLVNKLEFANEKDCPDFTHKNIAQCHGLQLATQQALNFGFSEDAHWFVFSLENSAIRHKNIYVEIGYALLDEIELHVFDSSGKLLEVHVTGDSLPFSERPISSPNFVFPIEVTARQRLNISIRVKTSSSLQVPILIWYPEQFVDSKVGEILLFGLFIGAMLVMAGYNLMLSLSTGDKSYLYFFATLTFYALVQSDLTGLSYAYLWPDYPKWNHVSLIIVSCLAVGSLAVFSHAFLQLKQNSVYTDKLLYLAGSVCALTILSTPFAPYRILIAGTSLLVGIVPIIAYVKSIQLWRQGYVPARYFMLAFSLFVMTAGIFVVGKFGLMDRNIITEYSIHFGALIVVTLLSLALADQVNQERREKEAAQASAITSLSKFEDIYNNSSEGIFQLDVDGRFIAVNPAFIRILGAQNLDEIQRKFITIEHMLVGGETDLLKRLKLRERTANIDLCCYRINGSEFWAAMNSRLERDTHDRLICIEGSIVDITERKTIEGRLRYLANYDQLTGLINRNAFQERLKKLLDYARENNSENALLYIDLDRFKVVNDTCGHLAGDELLKQLGVIFTHKVRQRDATARIGGDEFVILLENCNIDKAAQIGNELKNALNKFRFNWQGKQFDVGASIGIVPINQYSEGVVSLLNLADSVCLMAKEQGRNRIVVHDENAKDVNEKIQAKNLLATIHDAIEQSNFILFKQNIVSLNNPEMECYEILLRLKLKDELVGPGVFIPTAERYNVMPKIDRWVVTEYLEYLVNNPEILNRVDMATVNLSGQTLSNPDFLPYLFALLENHPEMSSRLCFELTESAALNNLSESSELIMKMKALGVRFAVDDFGSGYASYSYLTQLPIDFVKIDGSFCLNIDQEPINQTVVRSITEISHIMGMKVIAEFVETKEAMECLRDIGVDMVQGYYLDMPSKLVDS